MKTFFQTFYFILLVIITSILIPSIVNDYINSNYITNDSLKLVIIKLIVTITCLFFICLIISNIIKSINAKYYKLYNITISLCNNHIDTHIDTHDKVLDVLSVIKETSKNILAIMKRLDIISKIDTVNQDSLGHIRDNFRNMSNTDIAILEILKDFNRDNTNSLLGIVKIVEAGNNTINTNQLELLKSISELPNNISKDDVAKLTTRLDIILDNQKYLVDNLAKLKRVSKTKVKESIPHQQV